MKDKDKFEKLFQLQMFILNCKLKISEIKIKKADHLYDTMSGIYESLSKTERELQQFIDDAFTMIETLDKL